MHITVECSACRAPVEAIVQGSHATGQCDTCGVSVSAGDIVPGAGVTIGGFLIESLIGTGGMGQVYLARQLSLDRHVALKILRPGDTRSEEDLQCFLNEVRTLARMEHPGIVAAYASGQDNGFYYLAMGYVKGESLGQKLDRDGHLAERHALELLREVAVALRYAWNEHRVLHCDVKPSNILLTTDGEPKVSDLGLSRSLGDRADEGGIPLMGTPNYLSPEQARGDVDLDFRTDIYSLGASLHHMLSGVVPFHADSPEEILGKLETEALPDPRLYNRRICTATIDLLEKMTMVRPEDRQASYEELIGDVDAILQSSPYCRDGSEAAPVAKTAKPKTAGGQPRTGSGKRIVVRHSHAGRVLGQVSQAKRVAVDEGSKIKGIIGGVVVAVLLLGLLGTAGWMMFFAKPIPPASRSKPAQRVGPDGAPVRTGPGEETADAEEVDAPAEEWLDEPVEPGNDEGNMADADGESSLEDTAPVIADDESVVEEEDIGSRALKRLQSENEYTQADIANARRSIADIGRRLVESGFPRTAKHFARSNPEWVAGASVLSQSRLRRVLDLAKQARDLVLEKLSEDVGRNTTVSLKSGEFRMRIDGVEGDVVKVSQQVRSHGGFVGRRDFSFRWTDFAAAVKLGALRDVAGSDGAAMRGMVLVEDELIEDAMEHFEKAECLFGDLMCVQLAEATETASADGSGGGFEEVDEPPF